MHSTTMRPEGRDDFHTNHPANFIKLSHCISGYKESPQNCLFMCYARVQQSTASSFSLHSVQFVVVNVM